jgi:putative DNA primase/helicase
MNTSNFTFPKALTALPNWVCWRLEKVKGRDCKVPYNAKTGGKAMPNNPETWATFDEAVAAMQKYGFLGVGFMFTLESEIVGIDLDKCFDEHGNPKHTYYCSQK